MYNDGLTKPYQQSYHAIAVTLCAELVTMTTMWYVMIARVMTITGADCNVVMTTCHLTGMAGMISEFLGLSGYCSGYRSEQANFIKSHQFSSIFIKFHQISSNFIKFHQISSKFKRGRISSLFITFHQP